MRAQIIIFIVLASLSVGRPIFSEGQAMETEFLPDRFFQFAPGVEITETPPELSLAAEKRLSEVSLTSGLDFNLLSKASYKMEKDRTLLRLEIVWGEGEFAYYETGIYWFSGEELHSISYPD